MSAAIRSGNLGWRDSVRAMRMAGQVINQQAALRKAELLDIQTKNGLMRVQIGLQHQQVSGLSAVTQRIGYMGRVLEGAGRSLVKWGKNTQWSGRQLTVGLTVPLAFAAAAAARAALEHDAQMVRLVKVYDTGSRNIEAELDRLRDSIWGLAEDSAAAFGQSAIETTMAAAEFAAMGYTSEAAGGQLEGMTYQAQRMALLGEVELPDAINLVRSTQAAWRMDTEELTATLDRFNSMENATALQLRDLATSLPEVSAALAQLNIRAEYGAAALASMVESGLPAGEAAMALRALVTRLIAPSKVAVETARKFGIELEGIYERNGENGERMIESFAAQISNLSDSDRFELLTRVVEQRQAARVNLFFRQWDEAATGVENAWARATDVIGQSAEEAASRSATEIRRIQESASGQAKILSAQLKNEVIEAGQPLMVFFNQLRGWAIDILERFNNLSDGSQQWILRLAGLVAIIGPITMLGGLLANMVGTFLKIGGAMMAFVGGGQLLTQEQRAQQLVNESLTNSIHKQTAAIVAQTQAYMTLAGVPKTGPMIPGGPGGIPASRNAAANNLAMTGLGGQFTSALAKRDSALYRSGVSGGGLALGGFVAIAGITNQIKNNTKGIGDDIMNIGMAAFGLVPVLKVAKAGLAGLIAPASAVGKAIASAGAALRSSMVFLGPIGLAIAAIGAALYFWKKHSDDVVENFKSVQELSHTVATSTGLTWKTAEGIADELREAGTQSRIQIRLENLDLLERLQELTPEGREALAHQIAYELVLRGNDPALVKKQLDELFVNLGYSIPIELHLVGDTDTVLRGVELAAQEAIEHVQQAVGWADLQAELFGSGSQRNIGAAEKTIKGLAESIELLVESGDSEQLQQALLMIQQFDKSLESSGASTTDQAAAMQAFMDHLENMLGVDLGDWIGMNTDEMVGMSLELQALNKLLEAGAIDSVDYGMALKALRTGETIGIESQLTELRRRRDEIQERIREMGSGGLYSEELSQLNRDIAAIEKILNMRGQNVPDILSDEEIQAQAEEDASTWLSAFKSALGDEIGMVKDLAGEVFGKMEEELKEHFEAEEDAIDDRYSREIKAIKDTGDAVDELDDIREDAFRRERARLDFMASREQGRIDIRVAFAEGNIGEAAIIRSRMRHEEREFLMDSAESQAEADKKARDKIDDQRIDSLEAERDAAKERNDIAREAAEDQMEIRRKAFEYELDLLTRLTPTTAAEYQKMLGSIDSLLREYGAQGLGGPGGVGEMYAQITGGSLYDGFASATKKAQDLIANDKAWEAVGQAIVDGISRGMLGPEWDQFVIDMRRLGFQAVMGPDGRGTGIRRPGELGWIPVGTAHTGGMINGRGGSLGLKSDEVPIVVQRGEYVIDRATVKKYGEEYFRALQRHHEGGLVGAVRDAVLFGGASTALAGALYENTRGAIMDEIWARIAGGVATASDLSLTQTGGQLRGDIDATWGGKSRFPSIYPAGANWTYGMQGYVVRAVANVLASIPGAQTITSAYRDPRHQAAVNPSVKRSDHMTGRAVDIAALAQRLGGTPAQEAMGDTIATAFRRLSNVRTVLWKTMTGGNHFNHVHVSFMHGGGPVPTARVGAKLNHDTLLQAHKGETVLTSRLSSAWERGLKNLDGGAREETNIHVHPSRGMSEEQFAKKVVRVQERHKRRKGIRRSS